MIGQPKHGSVPRRRATTVAVCSALFAMVGGVLLATPANAGILGPSDSCTTPTTAVDGSAANRGVIDLSGSSTGLTLGVQCVTSVTLGGAAPAPTDSPSAPSQIDAPSTGVAGAASESTDATVDVADTGTTTIATDSATATDTAPGRSSSIASAVSSTTPKLATLSVLRSSNTVYPVKDGYEDTVRFAVRAMDASGDFVPVVGSAVLSKAGRTVHTWHIDGATKVITWNGRVGHTVRTGLYTMTVSAWSPDGTMVTERSHVRVLAKHLEKRTMVVRSNVGARSVSADIPRKLLKAYSLGQVTVRIRTVASVHGPAELVFANGDVVRRVPLKNGTHTTKTLAVPQGFSHVTITHAWAKGDATLKSLKAIWIYSTLS